MTQPNAYPKNRIQIATLNWRNRRNILFLDYSGFLCTQNMPVESNNEKLIAVIGDEVGIEWLYNHGVGYSNWIIACWNW